MIAQQLLDLIPDHDCHGMPILLVIPVVSPDSEN